LLNHVPAVMHPLHLEVVLRPRLQVVCGNRAGTWTVLLDQQGQYQKEQLQGEMEPSFVISSMQELVPLLEKHFDLQPPVNAQTVVMQEATAP
jgi:hypothetical protein